MISIKHLDFIDKSVWIIKIVRGSMARKAYYQWEHASGELFWQPKGVRDYLLKGELNRRFMKMIAWTGRRKSFTKSEFIETKVGRLNE